MARLVGLLVACAWVAGCGDAPKGDALAPVFGGGKADVGERVVGKGELGFGADAAAADRFAEDLEFHGYVLRVGAGAVVDLEVTHLGSSQGLDTTLRVYGPRTDAGGYGVEAWAFDDDAGYGKLSRLRDLALPGAGAYLVVVGTFDGAGRGSYRLQATCAAEACVPTGTPAPAAGACHEALADAIRACVTDWLADPDFDPSTLTEPELIAACADPEVVAPAFDALCAQAGAPADPCERDMEALATDVLPRCSRALRDEALDRSCVFGQTYGDLVRRPGPVVVREARTLRADSALDPLTRAQIVQAVRQTAYDDVETAEEAFAAVDGGLVNHRELWDASNRGAVSAYEVGAGDNSFGLLFLAGTTDVVARIQDSDLVDCTLMWGPERRPCLDDGECAAGLRCTGRAPETGRGRCVDTAADTDAAIGQACQGLLGCPGGLVCAGAATWGEGFCLPGWMQAAFASEPELPVPDDDPQGAQAYLLVEGLATVDVDVLLDLAIWHPRPADLRVSLLNPGGTEVVVFDGPAVGVPELVVERLAVTGFPGDESVNGTWRLRVVDEAAGSFGTLARFSLTLTSRWD